MDLKTNRFNELTQYPGHQYGCHAPAVFPRRLRTVLLCLLCLLFCLCVCFAGCAEAPAYDIQYIVDENTNITGNDGSAPCISSASGGKITFEVNIIDGYRIDSVTAETVTGQSVFLNASSEYHYNFVMPSDKVKITVRSSAKDTELSPAPTGWLKVKMRNVNIRAIPGMRGAHVTLVPKCVIPYYGTPIEGDGYIWYPTHVYGLSGYIRGDENFVEKTSKPDDPGPDPGHRLQTLTDPTALYEIPDSSSAIVVKARSGLFLDYGTEKRIDGQSWVLVRYGGQSLWALRDHMKVKNPLPGTGDDTPVMILSLMLLISIGSVAVLIRRRIREGLRA